jgi:hypothetical protein
MSALPERNRRLIEMMYMSGGGHSYEEIAVELGIPVASIGPTRIRCRFHISVHIDLGRSKRDRRHTGRSPSGMDHVGETAVHGRLRVVVPGLLSGALLQKSISPSQNPVCADGPASRSAARS